MTPNHFNYRRADFSSPAFLRQQSLKRRSCWPAIIHAFMVIAKVGAIAVSAIAGWGVGVRLGVW